MNAKTVLIVDDDLSLCDNLKDILQDEGYEPFSAITCADGLKLAQKQRPEVALLDLKLPDGQGTALMSDLKRLYSDCLCIIMTAYADLDSAVYALQKAAYHYLQKPVHPAELIRVLEGAFDTIRLRKLKRQAEEALRKNEELLRDFLDNANDLIQIVRPDGRFLYINHTLNKVLGYTVDEAFNLTISDIIHPDSLAHCSEIFQRIWAGEAVDRLEAAFITKDGRKVYVEGSMNCRFENGKPVNTRGIFRDITEQKKLEIRLGQAQKMEAIGTLAGGIAHDFNNILAAIMGYIEIANREVPEQNHAHQLLDKALKACDRAKDLVRHILAFSRKNGQQHKQVNAHLIVKEALTLLRASLPSTIEIRQNIVTESDTILADPTQIHQVMMNLCTNANHAMGEKGGVLKVTLASADLDADAAAYYHDLLPGPYVWLTVSDTGHGMDRTVIERIFDPYFTTKDKGLGTGLGLAIVQGIVKSHGGSISVSSEPGKGTEFELLFPRLDKDVYEKTRAPEALRMGHERVLFVDDEEDLVEIGKITLERLGYEFVGVVGSVEALEVFRAHPEKFDLVITDQTMPNMAGSELAKELKRIRPDIPVILCTGYSQVITEDQARDIGIQEFMTKPVGVNDFAKTIRKVLDKKQSYNEGGE